MGEKETCDVCGGTIPNDYNKFDPEAPVYGDDVVYHLDCEEAMFDEVYGRV